MVKQAVGEPSRPRRLHKSLLDIQLDQRNALNQGPGDHIGKHGPRFRMIFPHYEPHFRRAAPSAGPAHPLQEAGHRKWRVNLKRPFQPADVNAELQRGGGADGHEGIIILHLLFRALPVGGGKVSVVDEETVRFMVGLAILPQALADRLAFLPGIGKDQALFPPRMLKNIAHARIGGFGSGVRRWLREERFRHVLLSLIRLGIRIEKMLHGQTPDILPAIKTWDEGPASAADREKTSGSLRVPDGCREADPSGTAAGQSAEPFDQTEGLHAPVTAQQGMDLIDDDKAQIAEQGRDFHMLVDHQRFQGLRRDLQDAGGLSDQLPLLRLRRVPVPAGYGNPGFLTQLVEPSELVVDERF